MTKTKSILTRTMALVLLAGGVVGLAVGGCGKDEASKSPAADGAATKTEFVNDRCPMMGNPIDLQNVPASLTREHKGQKVAFCCAGCPVGWDKLTDEQKDEKLSAVIAGGARAQEP